MKLPATILLLCMLRSLEGQGNQDAERARVERFFRLANTGLSKAPLPPYELQGEPEVKDGTNPDTGWRDYSFQFGRVLTNPTTGHVLSASVDTPLDHLRANRPGGIYGVPRKVSDREALKLAQQYYTAAGYPEQIQVYGIDDFQGNNSMSLQVNYVPMHRGVPYERFFGGYMWLDREDGRARSFGGPHGYQPWVTRLPKPPANLVPRQSPEAARLAAMEAILRRWGGMLEESSTMPVHLCIWRPDKPRRGQYQWISANEERSARANEGRLIFSLYVLDQGGGTYPGSKAPWRSFQAFVDALSGRVLQIDHYPDAGGGNDGPGGSPVAVWPRGASMWRTSSGKGGWTKPVSGALSPLDGGEFTPSKEVFLTSGRNALRAKFDVRSGLVGVPRFGGGHWLARPTPALRAMLAR
jgi:hypothetical protein